MLRCRRSDLLLPEDLLDDAHGALYLCFKSSKDGDQRTTQGSAHQGFRHPCSELDFGDFGGLAPDDLLWPSSPAAYRHRWNVPTPSIWMWPLGLRFDARWIARLRGSASVPQWASTH